MESNNIHQTLTRLLAATEKLRMLDIEMPMQVASCFLFVALHEGCNQVDLVADLDMSEASVSRCTSWLSGFHRSNPNRGLNLLSKSIDPTNRRKRILVLTPMGKKLAKELFHTLNGD